MDERIMLRLDVDMLKTINRLSDEMGLSRSGLIRTALKEYLKF